MLTTELLQSYSGTTVQGNHFIHSCQTKNIELDFLEKYLKKMNDAHLTGSVVSYASSKKRLSATQPRLQQGKQYYKDNHYDVMQSYDLVAAR